MEITGEYVQLSVNDGTTMRAWTAWPKEEGPHPGLLVFQEAFGVNAHIRDVAGRFAREGFVTVAPELFHRTGPGFEGRYDDFPGVMP
ncbi:MAG: dienelactone hydrolase family protein, partial [Candidatus Acidiferrum sp.]